MRKLIGFTVVLVLIASTAFAADFVPQPLRLEGSETLKYAFDGSTLTVPISVTGAPAFLKFLVYTKGKESEITDIRNGYLGWHYVDKVDTCVYISGDLQYQPGNYTFQWDGKDQDGGVVPAGTYTYYLWGYDNVSTVVKAVPRGLDANSQEGLIVTDDQGTKLAQPILWNGAQNMWRWKLGSDPDDDSLMETCRFNLDEGWTASHRAGAWPVDPRDNSIVYGRIFNTNTVSTKAIKFNWIPNDVGTRDNVFDVEFSTLNVFSGIEYDDTYIYMGECNYKELTARTFLHIIDYANTAEGEYLGYVDNTNTFEFVDEFNQYQNQTEVVVLMNGGWTNSGFWEEKGWMVGGCHCTCLRAACEPRAWFDDSSDDGIRWENGNGDYVFDKNWEPTRAFAWICGNLGYNENWSSNGWEVDTNGFSEAYNSYTSIPLHVAGPDGTGIGKYGFAGTMEGAGARSGYTHLDADTAYDGAYFTVREADAVLSGAYYCGRDSFAGTITDVDISVDDDAPAAFSVAQNTPNPFNPTTTINFTLAKAGSVSVDVFNIAGQKVATLADGYRDAGAQSLVWDASNQAAGVYFYTVKSGDMSKTMKMTLIK